MALLDVGSPLGRDVLLGLVALGLLAGPLWTAGLHLGDPSDTYNRVEVATTDGGIEYAEEVDLPPGTPLSEDVDCAGWGGDLRACNFERHLLDEESLPTGVYTSNPNYTSTFSTFAIYSGGYYEYVQLDDAVYETSYLTNASARGDDGMYRVDMTLERAAPADVLDDVSVAVDDDELPSVVAETARSGETTARREVDVPATPVRLDDGSYYRVYRERGENDPSRAESAASWLLTYPAPLVGLSVLVRLSRRVEVTYHGDRR